MFVKLNVNFNSIIYTTIQGLESFAGINGIGVHHKKAWTPELEQIYSILPKRYWGDFQFTLMTINGFVPPHIDDDMTTAINFYINTDNGCGRTVFYKTKPGVIPIQNRPPLIVDSSTINVKDINYGDVYNLEDVEEINSFVAYDGDAYLIDITKLHTVINGESFNVRKALTLRTKKYSYIEVYDMLKETGNVV